MKKELQEKEVLVEETPVEEVVEETVAEEVVEEQVEDTPVEYVVSEEKESSEEVKKANPALKFSKLAYFLLSLLTLVGAYFAYTAFGDGVFYTDNYVFNNDSLTAFITNTVNMLSITTDYGSSIYSSADTIMPLIFACMFAIIYVIYGIILLVDIIILVFKVFGLLFSRKEGKVKFSKFSKTSLTFMTLTFALTCAGLSLPNAHLTEAGKTSLILTTVIFLVSVLVINLFNTLEAEKANWIEYGLDFAKAGLIVGVFYVLVSAISNMGFASLYNAVLSVDDTASAGEIVPQIIGMVINILEIIVILKVLKIGRIAIKNYPLNNNKKDDVNAIIKGKSITVIVLTIICLVGSYIANEFLANGFAVDRLFTALSAYKYTYLAVLLSCVVLILCCATVKKNAKEAEHIRN